MPLKEQSKENKFQEKIDKKDKSLYSIKISDNEYSTIIKHVKDNKHIDITTANSSSKKKSEQLAAKLALIKYHVISE